MPKLKISVSTSSPPSPSNSTVCSPNSSTPTHIESDTFIGDVLLRIKGFKGESGDGKERSEPEEPYFDLAERKGKTWSIMVRGRFMEDIDGDDLVFGNVFEKPIKDSLPWGTAVAVKFMHYVDPTMDSDFYADKPYALSPLIATTPYLSIIPHAASDPIPPFTAKDLKPLAENSLDGLVANLKRSGADEEAEDLEEEADVTAWAANGTARKAWVNQKGNRKSVKITKEDLVTIDFVQGFLDFNDLSVSLPSVGFHVDLLKYWDGQPVTFVARNRSGTKTFFSVSFEITDAAPATEGGPKEVEGANGKPVEKKVKQAEEEVEISDEVD